MSCCRQSQPATFPPFTAKAIRSAVERSWLNQYLIHRRGQKPVDAGLLVRCAVQLGKMLEDWAVVSEVDINPLLVRGGAKDAIVVDARMLLQLP